MEEKTYRRREYKEVERERRFKRPRGKEEI